MMHDMESGWHWGFGHWAFGILFWTLLISVVVILILNVVKNKGKDKK